MSAELEAAAKAVRKHLHASPWVDNPGAVYWAVGPVAEILLGLAQVTDRAESAVARASGSDDGDLGLEQARAVVELMEVRRALRKAVDHLERVQSEISHLTWDPSEGGFAS